MLCCAKLLQLCPTLYDPMDCRSPGPSVHGILQARILECVAVSFSRRSSWPRDWTCVSLTSPGLAGMIFNNIVLVKWQCACHYINSCSCVCVLSHVFTTSWTVACWASLSVGFSKQEYWSRLPFPPPGDLPDLGKPTSLTSPALAGRFFATSATRKALY